MINLTEYIQTDMFVESLNKDVVLSEVEHFSLDYDISTQKTTLSLYNEYNKRIGQGVFDSAELAVAIVEEYFDIDESDDAWLNGYEWVNESIQIDEALDPVEVFIEKKATEYNIRLLDIDNDAHFDSMYGIEVIFHSSNNRRDVDHFVKEVGYELLRTYGIQSYNYNGTSWKLAL